MHKLGSNIKVKDDQTISMKLLSRAEVRGEQSLQNVINFILYIIRMNNTDSMVKSTLPSTADEETIAPEI